MNKFERFASKMSNLLCEMRLEDINTAYVYYNGKHIPEEYVIKILDDPEHIKAMHEQIRVSVLNDVTDNPNKYMIKDDDYIYNCNTYNHAYIVDAYLEDQYKKDNPNYINVHVCDNCGSTNVQTKAWVRPNNNNKFIYYISPENDIKNNWCYCCNQNVTLSIKKLNEDTELIVEDISNGEPS